MAKSVPMFSIVVSMMFLILIQSMGCKSEVKSPRAVKRCGYEFISTYIYCCQYKNYCRRMEKGDVTDSSTKETQRVLNRLQATSFLSKQVKIARRSRRSVVNPYEECCIEGCTLKEISEYNCY